MGAPSLGPVKSTSSSNDMGIAPRPDLHHSMLSNLAYLGKGGQGLVYSAFLAGEGGRLHHVALKALRPDFHMDSFHVRRFMQEVSVHSALGDHPAVVGFHGFCAVPLAQLAAVTPPGVLSAGAISSVLMATCSASLNSSTGGGPQTGSTQAPAWVGPPQYSPSHKGKGVGPQQVPARAGANGIGGGGGGCGNSPRKAIAGGFGSGLQLNGGSPGLAGSFGDVPPRPSSSNSQESSGGALPGLSVGPAGPMCWTAVMELMTDGNLHELLLAETSGPSLAPRGMYTLTEAVQWLLQLTRAMLVLHSHRPLMIHRDLKAENVLLTRCAPGDAAWPGGRVAKLGDFGLVAAVDRSGNKVELPGMLMPLGPLPPLPARSVSESGAADKQAATAAAAGASIGIAGGGNWGPQQGITSSNTAGTTGSTPGKRELNKAASSGPHTSAWGPGHTSAWDHTGHTSSPPSAALTTAAASAFAAVTGAAAGLFTKRPSAVSTDGAMGAGGKLPVTSLSARVTGVSASGIGSAGNTSGSPFKAQRSLNREFAAPDSPDRPGTDGVATSKAPSMSGTAASTPPGVAVTGLLTTAASPAPPPPFSATALQSPPPVATPPIPALPRRVSAAVPPPLPVPPPPSPAIHYLGSTRRRSHSFGGIRRASMEEQQGTSPLQGQDRMVAGEPGGVELKRQRSQCEAGEADVDLLYAPLRSVDTGVKAAPGTTADKLLGNTPSKYDLLPTLYEMRFNLTGRCGSVMYMAPEVARGKPYNEKVDVFSFGVLAYELLGRTLMSAGMGPKDIDAALEHLKKVAWLGWRPSLPSYWHPDLKLLISLCWHDQPRLRPGFDAIQAHLTCLLQSGAIADMEAAEKSALNMNPSPLLSAFSSPSHPKPPVGMAASGMAGMLQPAAPSPLPAAPPGVAAMQGWAQANGVAYAGMLHGAAVAGMQASAAAAGGGLFGAATMGSPGAQYPHQGVMQGSLQQQVQGFRPAAPSAMQGGQPAAHLGSGLVAGAKALPTPTAASAQAAGPVPVAASGLTTAAASDVAGQSSPPGMGMHTGATAVNAGALRNQAPDASLAAAAPPPAPGAVGSSVALVAAAPATTTAAGQLTGTLAPAAPPGPLPPLSAMAQAGMSVLSSNSSGVSSIAAVLGLAGHESHLTPAQLRLLKRQQLLDKQAMLMALIEKQRLQQQQQQQQKQTQQQQAQHLQQQQQARMQQTQQQQLQAQQLRQQQQTTLVHPGAIMAQNGRAQLEQQWQQQQSSMIQPPAQVQAPAAHQQPQRQKQQQQQQSVVLQPAVPPQQYLATEQQHQSSPHQLPSVPALPQQQSPAQAPSMSQPAQAETLHTRPVQASAAAQAQHPPHAPPAQAVALLPEVPAMTAATAASQPAAAVAPAASPSTGGPAVPSQPSAAVPSIPAAAALPAEVVLMAAHTATAPQHPSAEHGTKVQAPAVPFAATTSGEPTQEPFPAAALALPVADQQVSVIQPTFAVQPAAVQPVLLAAPPVIEAPQSPLLPLPPAKRSPTGAQSGFAFLPQPPAKAGALGAAAAGTGTVGVGPGDGVKGAHVAANVAAQAPAAPVAQVPAPSAAPAGVTQQQLQAAALVLRQQKMLAMQQSRQAVPQQQQSPVNMPAQTAQQQQQPQQMEQLRMTKVQTLPGPATTLPVHAARAGQATMEVQQSTLQQQSRQRFDVAQQVQQQQQGTAPAQQVVTPGLANTPQPQLQQQQQQQQPLPPPPQQAPQQVLSQQPQPQPQLVVQQHQQVHQQQQMLTMQASQQQHAQSLQQQALKLLGESAVARAQQQQLINDMQAQKHAHTASPASGTQQVAGNHSLGQRDAAAAVASVALLGEASAPATADKHVGSVIQCNGAAACATGLSIAHPSSPPAPSSPGIGRHRLAATQPSNSVGAVLSTAAGPVMSSTTAATTRLSKESKQGDEGSGTSSSTSSSIGKGDRVTCGGSKGAAARASMKGGSAVSRRGEDETPPSSMATFLRCIFGNEA